MDTPPRLTSANVSEDLRNDYERAWWRACREVNDPYVNL